MPAGLVGFVCGRRCLANALDDGNQQTKLAARRRSATRRHM